MSACVLCVRDSLPFDDKECRLVAANAVVLFYAQRCPSVKRETHVFDFPSISKIRRAPQSVSLFRSDILTVLANQLPQIYFKRRCNVALSSIDNYIRHGLSHFFASGIRFAIEHTREHIFKGE